MDSLKKIKCLTGIELKKIYHQRKYQFLTVAAAAVGILVLLLGNVTSVLPYTVLSVLTAFLAPLSAMMLATDLVAGEMVQNELKILLTRPVERYQIILAKSIAIILYCGGLLMTAGIVSAILAVISAGAADISLFVVLFAYLISLMPVAAMSALFVLIAVISRSPSVSFGGSLLLYIGSIAAGLIFSGIAALLPTSYLSIGTMVIGTQIPLQNLLTGLALLLGYGCISFCLSGLIFQKKDFV